MNRSTLRLQRITGLTLLMPLSLLAQPAVPAEPLQKQELKPFRQEIPVSAVKIDLVPVPASADGAIKPFYISKTEITWEVFDVYIYRLDEEAGKGPKNADAVSRPSKPYLPPDRGFGHEGYAAISMSAHNAAEFCVWLSAQTGRKYRLPTEAEWEHAARMGADGKPVAHGMGAAVDQGKSIDESAWHAGNSGDTPHPVGKKNPTPLGLHDLLGNVSEWVTGKEGKPVTKGGSFRDEPAKLTVEARQPISPSWNASDPQVPKSAWWLSDAPFIGFRVVCELPADSKAASPATSTPAPTAGPTTTPSGRPSSPSKP